MPPSSCTAVDIAVRGTALIMPEEVRFSVVDRRLLAVRRAEAAKGVAHDILRGNISSDVPVTMLWWQLLVDGPQTMATRV